MSEDFRMGFDAGTRSCQHMMQLRIDDLQAKLAAAEARCEKNESAAVRMFRDELEYDACNNARNWIRDYPWIHAIALHEISVGEQSSEAGGV